MVIVYHGRGPGAALEPYSDELDCQDVRPGGQYWSGIDSLLAAESVVGRGGWLWGKRRLVVGEEAFRHAVMLVPRRVTAGGLVDVPM